MKSHLRRKIKGLKRKFKQFAPKHLTEVKGVSDSKVHNITVADIKNVAAVVNTWRSNSSQKVSSNQVTHINQEIH